MFVRSDSQTFVCGRARIKPAAPFDGLTKVASMNTYKGTALLLLDGDRQVATGADLNKDASGTWRGTLTFPVEARTPELINLREGRLRINGRDGKFIRSESTSRWAANPAGQLRIRIEGNGDAPF